MTRISGFRVEGTREPMVRRLIGVGSVAVLAGVAVLGSGTACSSSSGGSGGSSSGGSSGASGGSSSGSADDASSSSSGGASGSSSGGSGSSGGSSGSGSGSSSGSSSGSTSGGSSGATDGGAPWCLAMVTASSFVLDECTFSGTGSTSSLCTINGAGYHSVASCPTTNLAGCCNDTATGTVQCYYNDDSMFSSADGGVQAMCTSQGATWQASP
jgi:hypothetical protein